MKKMLALAAAMMLVSCEPAFAQVRGAVPVTAAALSTTVATIKSGNSTLQWLHCYNPSNAAAFVQIFDTAGAVTLGTTVPKVSIGIATLTSAMVPAPTSFLAGIKAAATTTATGSSAPSAAVVCNFGVN